MCKILITGGNGYLARNLTPLFESKGYYVHAPCRRSLDMTKWDSIVQYFDLHDYDFDAIIHTAIQGGMREEKDTYEHFVSNITMFENLMTITCKSIPIIIYGSGAEFDRRFPIDDEDEEYILRNWPIDPYGLSKNIISRRILANEYEKDKVYILRLFGCFNHDEEDTRFIKKSIVNTLNREPITINQNKYMDFFYLDDVFSITDSIIQGNLPVDIKHMNLVYKEKLTLLQIAEIICKYLPSNKGIKLTNTGMGTPYTGCGFILNNGIKFPLIGLEEGIRRTIEKLL